MDLDFKNCEYYKEAEEKEHCPFSTVCKDNCFFSLMHYREAEEEYTSDYEELVEENENLKDRIHMLKMEIDDANEMISRLEQQIAELQKTKQ